MGKWHNNVKIKYYGNLSDNRIPILLFIVSNTWYHCNCLHWNIKKNSVGFINLFSPKLILQMFEHGKLNSARGIYHILRHLEIVNPEDTVVDQVKFQLIKFFCILTEKIVMKGLCREGCHMQRTFTREQIIIK